MSSDRPRAVVEPRHRDRRPTIDMVTGWNYTGDDFYCDLAVPHTTSTAR